MERHGDGRKRRRGARRDGAMDFGFDEGFSQIHLGRGKVEVDLKPIAGPDGGGLLKAGATVPRKRPEEKHMLMFPLSSPN